MNTTIRDLAIEGAIHAIIRSRLDPLVSAQGIQDRGSMVCIPGSDFYTVTFDEVEIIRVYLTSAESFLLKILLP